MKETAGSIVAFLGSRRFLYGVLIFFALESIWVALSSVYPMAFDEEVHLGIIAIYADQWSPFLSGQPPDAAQFGALAADPSYLFHYIMSFPYRFVRLFTDSQAVVIIVLRLLNVALAVCAAGLFARVLRRAGMSRAFTHTALALFVLIPIVPVVAGQINYDTAVWLLLAVLCLLVFQVQAVLCRRRVPLSAIILLLVVCMVASIVKYAFLPFAVAAVVWVALTSGLAFRGRFHTLLPELAYSYRTLGVRTKVILAVLLLVSTMLFMQRYAVNTVRYHTPVPSCDQALSIRDCLAYGPWARNYGLAAAKSESKGRPLAYTWHWLQALHYRMFFAVNGPADSYRNYPPLPLPSTAAVLLAVTGTLALGWYGWRALRYRPLLLFLMGMSLFYLAVLWVEDYSQFLETGQPVAINGRYVLPVLLPLAAVAGTALGAAFRSTPRLKVYSAIVLLVLFLQGGGVLTFIARSDAAWYWPNPAVRAMNEGAQRLLLPVLYEGSRYYR